MGLRGDEVGLLWTTPVRAKGAGMSMGPSPIALKKLAERPGARWTAPAELPRLRGRKRISYDVETRDEQLTELGPGARRKDCYIVGYAIGTDEGDRWYLPIRHEGGGNLDPDLVNRWARDELNAFDGEVVGAHLLYDLDFSANEGITFPNVKAFHDVQVAEPLLDEWRFSFALEALAQDYLGEGKDEGLLRQAAEAYGFGTTEKAIKSNLWRLPAEFVGPYAEGDVDRPLRIIDKQIERLLAEGLWPVYTMERKLIPLLLAMRRRGVRVDIGRAEQVMRDVDAKLVEVTRKLKHMAGKSAEFTAGNSFAKALQERGIPVPHTPSSGKVDPKTGRKRPMVLSVTKPFLEKFKNDELVATVLEGRKLSTINNTFMKGHILGHQINGRIHCEFNQLKSEEGGTIARFSSSNPNLQNIPARDEELAPLIRSVFIPEEGETWERLDESQVEYRLLVNFARGQGAEEARQKYRDDPTTDFHVMCGEFLGADASDAFIRKRVKGVNFCKIYGGGIPKLAATFGTSIPEAKIFSDKYDTALPFVQTTFEAAMYWAEKRGFVETLMKRKQRFSLWEPFGNFGENQKPPLLREEALQVYGPRIKRAWIYAALNRKLQASAADIMKKAMIDSWEAGIYAPGVLGAPLLTVHDEQDISKPQTKIGEEAMREAKRLMETGFPELRVPLICDRSSGVHWGEAK